MPRPPILNGSARFLAIRHRIALVIFVILVLSMATFLGYNFVYQPLKFAYLISRVESAKTAAEERQAFTMAARGGRIWELNWQRPPGWSDRARDVTGDWVLELEWLECSAWTGKPFRAHHRILDSNNMEILYVRYDK